MPPKNRATPSNPMGSSNRRPLIGALLRAPHNAVVEHVHAEFVRTGFGDIGPAHVTKQTMGHLVDNRAKLVRMTARGWQVHDLADRLVANLERRWARQLGADRFEQLRALLSELGSVAGG